MTATLQSTTVLASPIPVRLSSFDWADDAIDEYEEQERANSASSSDCEEDVEYIVKSSKSAPKNQHVCFTQL